MQKNGEGGEQTIDWVLETFFFQPRSSAVFGKKHCSTAYHLVSFDRYSRNAFAKKEHVIGIFADLEKKAYDTTWLVS